MAAPGQHVATSPGTQAFNLLAPPFALSQALDLLTLHSTSTATIDAQLAQQPLKQFWFGICCTMHVPLHGRAQCMNMQLPLLTLHSACSPQTRQAIAHGESCRLQRARQQRHTQSWISRARTAPMVCASAVTDQVYKAISDNQEATITVVTGTQLVQEVRTLAALHGTPGNAPAPRDPQLNCFEDGVTRAAHDLRMRHKRSQWSSSSINPVLCAPSCPPIMSCRRATATAQPPLQVQHWGGC